MERAKREIFSRKWTKDISYQENFSLTLLTWYIYKWLLQHIERIMGWIIELHTSSTLFLWLHETDIWNTKNRIANTVRDGNNSLHTLEEYAATDPMPPINKDFALVLQKEQHSSLAITDFDSVALLSELNFVSRGPQLYSS